MRFDWYKSHSVTLNWKA